MKFIKKFIFLFAATKLVDPKKNTINVCMKVYKESSPNTLGVNTLLFVIV